MENRTVKEIYNLKLRVKLDANEILDCEEHDIFRLRAKIQKQFKEGDVELVCLYCKQPVALTGRRARVKSSKHYFFTHLYRSNDCIVKTMHRLTEEEVRRIKYNGTKESELHIKLKNKIGSHLKQQLGNPNVAIDRVYKNISISKEWRKPDVLANYGERKLAFELQLTTTFLSVIVDRSLFYQKQGIHLIWVFAEFLIDTDLQRFTEKDVYYNNNFNVYVFDDEAQKVSQEKGRLILRCYYKEFYIEQFKVKSRWNSSLIELEDLNFNDKDKTLFHYDSDASLEQANKNLGDLIRQAEIDRRNALIKQQIARPLEHIRNLYRTDQYHHELDELIQNMNAEQTNALNEQLKFNSTNAHLIKLRFLKCQRSNFLHFLFNLTSIKVNTSNFDGVLTALMNVDNDWHFQMYLVGLFKLGYKLNEADKALLDGIFADNRGRTNQVEVTNLYKWAFIHIISHSSFSKIDEPTQDLAHILFALLSLKLGIIVGSRLRNFKELTNNIILHHYNYGDLYLRAMDFFNRKSMILGDDKTGKVHAVIATYLKHKNKQETRFDSIIFELFPELNYGQ